MKLIHIRNNAFAMALSFLTIANVHAGTCTPDSNGNLTVGSGSSCTDYLLNNAGANGGVLVNAGTISGNDSITNAPIYIANGTLSGLNNNAAGNITSAIGGDYGSVYVNTLGNITSVVNAGVISASGSANSGIYNIGSIGLINNNLGIISSVNNAGIANGGTISSLINSGTITGGYDGIHSGSGSTISTLTNMASGVISSGGNVIELGGSIGTLNNYGAIKIISPTFGDQSWGVALDGFGSISTIATLNNFTGGIISADWAIYVSNYGTSSTITTLNNYGSIRGLSYGVYIDSSSLSSIGAINNQGDISGGIYGIYNQGVIGILNNAQGGSSSTPAQTALTYTGNLPTNYNIIINSPTHYGQLAVTGASGTTTFGIYSGGVTGVAASTLNKGTYSSVLSGVAASNLTGATAGKYNGFTWSLSETDTANGIWNLLVTGASTADTQQSLVNTSAALQNTFTLQNTVLANSFSYDCNVFGANDVCVSAGGRNTAVSAANGLNNTSALLIAAYRVMPSVRIGAYADQNLSVNNAGSTVNIGNNTPLVGLFGAWNERLDGTGTEVKVSAAYGQKNTTVTRQVVGTSEAGSGSSQLNSQGAQVTAKYGFGVTPDVIVSPYVGMRYTQNNMNGYSEQATSSVTAPLTYSSLNTNATTALAGVGASYRFIPQATAFASAGVETDTNTSNGTYSATGVTGLTPINFNANPVRTRPTATVGAYYDIEKNQRLGITGIYRQEPYQAVQTTTVMATYTVGL